MSEYTADSQSSNSPELTYKGQQFSSDTGRLLLKVSMELGIISDPEMGEEFIENGLESLRQTMSECQYVAPLVSVPVRPETLYEHIRGYHDTHAQDRQPNIIGRLWNDNPEYEEAMGGYSPRSYGTKELNLRSIKDDEVMDKPQVRGMLLGAKNNNGEDGLHFTDRDLASQRFEAERLEYQFSLGYPDQQLRIANVTDVIFLAAMHREQGSSLFSNGTTSFPQMPTKLYSKLNFVGSANEFLADISLSRWNGKASKKVGTRLTVGPSPDQEPFQE